MNTAIIVAGGSGTRMNHSVRKQYLSLDGIPVLKRTLDTFACCDVIDRICLVVPEEDIDYCNEKILILSESRKPIRVVAGGVERQQSVYNGITSYDDFKENDILIIHDGVRPFIGLAEIEKCIHAAIEYDASITAIPAVDTIKQTGPDNFIDTTIDRKNIWLAQTPQAFKYKLLITAHNHAIENGITGTDDSSLVEMTGGKVKIIEGQRSNIKITTQEDLIIAEALVRC